MSANPALNKPRGAARVGVGGPVGSGKTALLEQLIPRFIARGTDLAVITNDLVTDEGVSYEKIAKLHGSNVLATTVVQTCIRYDADQRCRFCSIEESLRSGSTVAVKKPADLAAVARAAVELDVARRVLRQRPEHGGEAVDGVLPEPAARRGPQEALRCPHRRP